MLFGNKIHLIIEVARNIKLLLIYYAIIQLYMTVQQVNFADLIFFKVSIIYWFKILEPVDLIHDTRHLCLCLKTYAMSGGFFEGNVTSAHTFGLYKKSGSISLFIWDNRKWRTMTWLKLIVARFYVGIYCIVKLYLDLKIYTQTY